MNNRQNRSLSRKQVTEAEVYKMLKGLKSGAGMLKGTSAASGTAARNFSFTVNGSQATAGTTTCHVKPVFVCFLKFKVVKIV